MYRTPDTPPQHFSRLNTLHLHIDGPLLPAELETVIIELERFGFAGKVHQVLDFLTGPQRKEKQLRQTFRYHTSGYGWREHFSAFSTTLLRKREDVRFLIPRLIERLRRFPGSVIEFEHIVSNIEDGKLEETQGLRKIYPVTKEEAGGFAPKKTLPFEIHHAFDIRKRPEDKKPPIPLPEILKAGNQRRITTGGWFVFEKDGAWAYRSNAFAKEFEASVSFEHKLLREYIQKERSIQTTVRTLVERVLGIWRIS